ncbi:MAG: LuxR C-terminal-related transcriptional regulator [Gaiellaceae bacterium]
MRRQLVCVGIVDGEHPFRAGVRAALEQAGHRIVAEAGSLEELAVLCAGQALDLVLVEELLLVGAEEIASRFPRVVIARTPTLDGLFAAYESGAVGYLERAVSAERLIAAVDDAAAGIHVAPSALMSLLLERWRPRSASSLTPRQRQVQLLSEKGSSTQEIADALGVSPITVRRHRSAFTDHTRPTPTRVA